MLSHDILSAPISFMDRSGKHKSWTQRMKVHGEGEGLGREDPLLKAVSVLMFRSSKYLSHSPSRVSASKSAPVTSNVDELSMYEISSSRPSPSSAESLLSSSSDHPNAPSILRVQSEEDGRPCEFSKIFGSELTRSHRCAFYQLSLSMN
jgi:hypothetical protein